MEVLHPRCAGLDVHKDSVVAAVRLAEPGGVKVEVRRFDTTTPGCTAPGFLDTGLHYAARLKVVSSHAARASSGLR